jgi:hypothetical protein
LCLRQMPKDHGGLKIFLTHFPPVGATFEPNVITHLLAETGIGICIFGHLHNVSQGQTGDQIVEGVRCVLTSCDYLRFTPKLVCEVG